MPRPAALCPKNFSDLSLNTVERYKHSFAAFALHNISNCAGIL